MTDRNACRVWLLYSATLCGLLLAPALCVYAQQQSQAGGGGAETAGASFPDAPVPISTSASDENEGQTTAPALGAIAPSTNSTYVQGKQTKRILEVMPNFRSVSADQKLPPQGVKDKFTTTMQDSFDYSAFIFAGGLAGVAQAENSNREFHQGAAGFGRYYWHTLADQTDENIFVEFIVPAALHQDSRYYTLGHGGLLKRTAYSFSRLVITRSDDDREVPNFSEIVGAGAASGISDLYYPSQERTWTKTGQRWLTSVILDGATYTLQEFWPDINDHLFHQQD